MFNKCKRNVVLSDMGYLGEVVLFVIGDVICDSVMSERCDKQCGKWCGLWSGC